MREYLQKFKPLLSARASTMEKMIFHLTEQRLQSFNIIETGTARAMGNWAGDGQSTLLWDWYLTHQEAVNAFSIDINIDYIRNAKSQTKRVNYVCGDSVIWLANMKNELRDCKLLYLDSFDLDQSNPHPSALHHLKELTAAWGHLPIGCMVAVDDCISEAVGKHIYVAEFFKHLRIEPVFTGYQWGWIKV
jgi:hypothetical protein